MIIQDLAKKCDLNEVYTLYTKYFDIIDDYLINQYTEEEIKLIQEKYKKGMETIINDLKSHDTTQSDNIVFVVQQTNTDFADPYAYYDVFHIKQKELLEKGKKPFTLWNDDLGNRIEHYCFDFLTRKEIAGFNVSDISIQRYGINLCMTIILHPIMFWGFDEKDAEEYKENCISDLEKSLENIENGTEKYIDADDLFEKLHQEILDSCETEEERLAIIQDRKERKEHRKKNHDFLIKTMNENHKCCIDIVKEEYDKLINSKI